VEKSTDNSTIATNQVQPKIFRFSYALPINIRNVFRWDPDSIFRDRDFIFVWFSQITTLIGGGILGLAVAFMADTGELAGNQVSASGSSMGLVILLNNLPSFFVAFIAGVLADWFDRKKIMFVSNIFRFVLLFIFLIFGGWHFATFAYIVIFLKSAAKQIFIPSEASIIPDIVKKDNILTARTLFNLTEYVTYLLGFIIAGPLLSLLGPSLLVLSLMGMFLIASVALLFVRVPEREYKVVSVKQYVNLVKDFSGSFVEGIKYIGRDKIQRIVLVHNLVSQAFLYMFIALIFKLGSFLIGLTPTNIGIVSVLPLGIGILVCLILMNKKYKNTKRMKLSAAGVFIEAIAFTILSLASLVRWNHLVLLGISTDASVTAITSIGAVLIGLGFPLLLTPAQTLVQEQTEQGFLGRVFGVWSALSQAIASIPAVIVGYFADYVIGVPTTLIWISGIAFVYAIILSRYKDLA